MNLSSHQEQPVPRARARDWLKTFNSTARTAVIPTENVMREVARLSPHWNPQSLAGYVRAHHPTLGAGGIAASLEAIPDTPPPAPPTTSGPKPRRHHAVVTANTDTDHDQLPWLVTCNTCIEHAVWADGRRSEPEGWDYTGEWKVSDATAAHELAARHDRTPST